MRAANAVQLAAILAEQRRAAAAVIAEPGRGVSLWMADWVAEEILIMEEAMSEKYRAFFARVWAAREGSMDGCDIEDAAVDCGLAERVQASAPCGEACACEMYGFPGECVRLIKPMPEVPR